MADTFKVYQNVSDAALEYAVWTLGDYPQVPWDEALRRLIDGIKSMGYNELRPFTIWRLGRKVIGKEFQYLDFEEVRKWTRAS